MIKKLKTFLLSTLASALLLVPVAIPVSVMAQGTIADNLCSGADFKVDPNAACDPNTGDAQGSVERIITTIINIFSLLVGVVSVIMIIIGGLKYITSGGEGANITGAKNTILYAIIGLVVVALAQVIVKFVLAKATTT